MRRTVLSLITLFRPRLADWAILVISDSVTGGLLLSGGSDAGFSAVVERDSVAGPGLDRVLRTGRTELRVSADPTDELSNMVPHRALVAEAAELRPVTVLGLGLTARGTTLGALVIARRFGRSFDDDEIAFAEHIAARAALALASARMYEERSLIASELQHRLRPRTLPEIPGVRLAASYRPAAEHLDIGGDFYDVHGSGDDWPTCWHATTRQSRVAGARRTYLITVVIAETAIAVAACSWATVHSPRAHRTPTARCAAATTSVSTVTG
jgi:sigma-B regulation protein RsbU (phosphoserine phosphatase)